jgi:hypothetical protein
VIFCAECSDFPCDKLKPLYKRYKSIHKIDLAANRINATQDIGAFLVKQQALYTCKHCGGIINMHYSICSDCGEKSI